MRTITRMGAMPLASTCRPVPATSVRVNRGNVGALVSSQRTIRTQSRGRTAVQPRAMFGGLAKMFKGDPSKKTQERLQPIVDATNALETSMKALSDDDLKAKTAQLKERVAAGESLEDVRAEAFAVRTRPRFAIVTAGPWTWPLLASMCRCPCRPLAEASTLLRAGDVSTHTPLAIRG